MKHLALFFLAIFAISCNYKNQTTTEEKQEEKYLLIGKKGTINFPEMKAEVSYPNDSTLHWKTIDKEGKVGEGDEKMVYKKLSDHLHFLNWIEKDGFTVSQIIDTKEGTVKAFWSFADEKSESGKRASMLVDGKFEFTKE